MIDSLANFSTCIGSNTKRITSELESIISYYSQLPKQIVVTTWSGVDDRTGSLESAVNRNLLVKVLLCTYTQPCNKIQNERTDDIISQRLVYMGKTRHSV